MGAAGGILLPLAFVWKLPHCLRTAWHVLRHRSPAYLQIVDLKAGADINDEEFKSIERADAFLVFGPANYVGKTENPAYIYFESEFARAIKANQSFFCG